MVLLDVDTNVSGAAITAAIIRIPYKKKKGMRGMVLIDALPTILTDTSTCDLTDFDPHATVNENQYWLMFACFFLPLNAAFVLLFAPRNVFLSLAR